MERTLTADVKQQIGETILLKGWIHTIRKQGSLIFMLLRDRTGLLQVIVEKKTTDVFETCQKLTVESVVALTGLVKEEQQAPGGYEVAATTIEVLSAAAPELPIPVVDKERKTNQQARLDWRWLDLRRPENYLIFQVWTAMEQAFRTDLIKRGFVQIHSPKFMNTPSESGAELFEVKYFDRVAYLAQSPQFYKQMAQAAGFEGIFEVGPVFRANPSFTSRHDTEFTGYDVEFSFIESHTDVMRLESELLVAMLKAVSKQYGPIIEEQYKRKIVVPTLPFPSLTLQEAKKILKSQGLPSEKPDDLSPEEERALSAHILKTQKHEFVFVTDYPISIRPFYHMRHADDPTLTRSFDLLWNGLEITTGAQREHRYDVLKQQAEEKGLNLEPLKHYLNFFKYGCPPHGGFGMGPSRMLMKIFNVENVREVTYLYRGVKRLTP